MWLREGEVSVFFVFVLFCFCGSSSGLKGSITRDLLLVVPFHASERLRTLL